MALEGPEIPPEAPKKDPKMTRHLDRLPIKSFKVASGDIVGGLIYVMNKPIGIEEGMVGLSIDSAPYREFVRGQLKKLMSLDISEEVHIDKELFDRFHSEEFQSIRARLTDELTPEQIDAVIADKLHEKIDPAADENDVNTQWKNVGMGGLLFDAYKRQCGVKADDHFAVQIQKLIKRDQHKPDGDKAYMVKQDGVLSKALGRTGTGPGLGKILGTTTSKKDREKAERARKEGRWNAGYLAFKAKWIPRVKAFGYVFTKSTKKVNFEAIREVIATKIASKRGFSSQDIDTIEGTYQNGSPKIASIVTWSPGCRDLSGQLTGGEETFDSVVTTCDQNGKPIKVDDKGNIYRTVKEKQGDKEVIKYQIVSPNSPDGAIGAVKECSKEEYEKAKGMAVSDDTIAGLGESLVAFLDMGDRDGIGKLGQNKGVIPIDPPQGRFTRQFFGIDFGKSYKGKNKIVESLSDDFTFDNPKGKNDRFVNYSMLYDNPLREKMKGVYLLGALRGLLFNKEVIAMEYERAGDKIFADKLRGYPKSVGGQFSDLDLIKEEAQKYRNLEKTAKENANKATNKKERDKFNKQADEYSSHAKEIDEIHKIALDSDIAILKVFEKRITLTPSQIDILDNLEKLTAPHCSIDSPDGRVRLNHIRVNREDRVAWQLSDNNDGTFNLFCEEANSKKLQSVREKLDLLSGHPDPNVREIVKIFQKAPTSQIRLTQEQLTLLSQHLTEDLVATARNLKGYRSQAARDEFHERLDRLDKPAKLPSHKEEEELREKAKVAEERSLGPKPLPLDIDEDIIPPPPPSLDRVNDDIIPPPPPPRTPLPVESEEDITIATTPAPTLLDTRRHILSKQPPLAAASASQKPQEPPIPRPTMLLFNAPSPARRSAPPALEPAIEQPQSSVQALAAKIEILAEECRCSIPKHSNPQKLPIQFKNVGIIYASNNTEGGITFSTPANASDSFAAIADKLCQMAVRAVEPGDSPLVFKISGDLDPKKQEILQKAFATHIDKAIKENRFERGKEPKVEVADPTAKKAVRPS